MLYSCINIKIYVKNQFFERKQKKVTFEKKTEYAATRFTAFNCKRGEMTEFLYLSISLFFSTIHSAFFFNLNSIDYELIYMNDVNLL